MRGTFIGAPSFNRCDEHDLKAFTNEFYQQMRGDLETVKTTISNAAKQCHIELQH